MRSRTWVWRPRSWWPSAYVAVGTDPQRAVAHAQLELGPGGGGGRARDRRPVRSLQERVAALEGALRVVGGERHRERVELAAAGSAGLRIALERRGAAQVGALALRDRAGARGAHLAQLLVQPRAVPLDVVGRRAREPG